MRSEQIARRLAGLALRGILRSVTVASGVLQRMAVALPYGERELERLQPWGLQTRPQVGAEALVLSLGPDQQVVLQCGDVRHELALTDGAVVLHDAHGHQVHLSATGVLVVTNGHDLRVQSSAAGPAVSLGGLVHGLGVDPFTGATYASLGATTAQVKAEKT